jgi:hypothetical protein
MLRHAFWRCYPPWERRLVRFAAAGSSGAGRLVWCKGGPVRSAGRWRRQFGCALPRCELSQDYPAYRVAGFSDKVAPRADEARQCGASAMQEVTDWLEKLGLGQYAERFAENDISFSLLPDLTDQDLKTLGSSTPAASGLRAT